MSARKLFNGLVFLTLLLTALLGRRTVTARAAEPLNTLETTEAADDLALHQPPGHIASPGVPFSEFSAVSESTVQGFSTTEPLITLKTDEAIDGPVSNLSESDHFSNFGHSPLGPLTVANPETHVEPNRVRVGAHHVFVFQTTTPVPFPGEIYIQFPTEYYQGTTQIDDLGTAPLEVANVAWSTDFENGHSKIITDDLTIIPNPDVSVPPNEMNTQATQSWIPEGQVRLTIEETEGVTELPFQTWIRIDFWGPSSVNPGRADAGITTPDDGDSYCYGMATDEEYDPIGESCADIIGAQAMANPGDNGDAAYYRTDFQSIAMLSGGGYEDYIAIQLPPEVSVPTDLNSNLNSISVANIDANNVLSLTETAGQAPAQVTYDPWNYAGEEGVTVTVKVWQNQEIPAGDYVKVEFFGPEGTDPDEGPPWDPGLPAFPIITDNAGLVNPDEPGIYELNVWTAEDDFRQPAFF